MELYRQATRACYIIQHTGVDNQAPLWVSFLGLARPFSSTFSFASSVLFVAEIKAAHRQHTGMADKAKKGAVIKETPKVPDVVLRDAKLNKKDKDKETSPALLRRLSIFGRK